MSETFRSSIIFPVLAVVSLSFGRMSGISRMRVALHRPLTASGMVMSEVIPMVAIPESISKWYMSFSSEVFMPILSNS